MYTYVHIRHTYTTCCNVTCKSKQGSELPWYCYNYYIELIIYYILLLLLLFLLFFILADNYYCYCYSISGSPGISRLQAAKEWLEPNWLPGFQTLGTRIERLLPGLCFWKGKRVGGSLGKVGSLSPVLLRRVIGQIRYGRGRNGKHKCWKQSLVIELSGLAQRSMGLLLFRDKFLAGERSASELIDRGLVIAKIATLRIGGALSQHKGDSDSWGLRVGRLSCGSGEIMVTFWCNPDAFWWYSSEFPVKFW